MRITKRSVYFCFEKFSYTYSTRDEQQIKKNPHRIRLFAQVYDCVCLTVNDNRNTSLRDRIERTFRHQLTKQYEYETQFSVKIFAINFSQFGEIVVKSNPTKFSVKIKRKCISWCLLQTKENSMMLFLK